MKIALHYVRCPLQRTRISVELACSFVERWALQFAYYRASGTAQISVVQYQFYMESQRSTSIESVNRPIHSILRLPGSVPSVLASPDTEMAPPRLPISKIFGTLFLHEDMVRSGQKNVVEQRSVSSRRCANLSQNGPLLPGTVGVPTCLLLGKRDGTEIHCAVPIIDRISAFQMHRIYRRTLLQYSPNSWVPAPRSDISRSRNSAPKSPNIENSPACIHPPPSPLCTIVRIFWRPESRPI